MSEPNENQNTYYNPDDPPVPNYPPSGTPLADVSGVGAPLDEVARKNLFGPVGQK